MEMKASDLSARLLATENLSVVRARTRTASFDIKSRVLTLPMWKEMSPEIEDMLIGHEVGHALYTTDAYMKPIEDNPKIRSYLNVIEDVRIEKLIKRKYPGLRKRMSDGYKQLNDRDFFGVGQIQSFNELNLIDKINLYFKAGVFCGVKFTPEEKSFVERAERTETIEDVITLANDVYAFSRKQLEERKKQMQEMGLDSNDEEEEDPIESDFDIDFDEDFDDEEAPDDMDEIEKTVKSSKSSRETDEQPNSEEQDLESKTERIFASKLSDLADDSTEYNYWTFDTDYMDEVVVPFKKILSETKSPEQWLDGSDDRAERFTRYSEPEYLVQREIDQKKDFEQFKVDTSRAVNYLVKEFEMRKSATLYKRAQVSKIGSLDMKKVYAYKLKDDIFKRVTTLPQGKNHGMIMLVDWSGSMNEVLQDTIKQVINLAMFCNRVQIPYRVYAFTSAYFDQIRENACTSEEARNKRHAYEREFETAKRAKAENEKMIGAANPCFNLLELFSNKMTTSEFNSMARRLLHWKFQWNRGYETSGTPLNEALVWCYNNVGSFVKNNNIEKMTFITLTDGEGHSLTPVGYHRGLDEVRTEIVGAEYKRIKQKHYVRDEVTQKTYEFNRYGNYQTRTILQMMKDRYNIAVLGFHICQNHRRDLRGAMQANLPDFRGNDYFLIEEWRKDFRANGFASIKNTGRDDLFLIPQSSTKIKEGELDVNPDANAKSIAKNFGKYLNTKKTSRVLLNNFIGYVA
jgi:hypothetical protein